MRRGLQLKASSGAAVARLFVIGGILTGALMAGAQVPHYTYGATGTFGSAGGWGYNANAMTLDSTDDEFSARFTAMENITVDNAWQMFNGMDAGTTVRVGIMADSGGSPSGTYLSSGTLTFTASASVYTNVIFSSSVALTSGNVYHLVTQAPTIPGANSFIIRYGGTEQVRPYDRAVDTSSQDLLRRFNGGAWATTPGNANFVLCNGTNVIPGPSQPYSATVSGSAYQTRGGGGAAYGVRFMITSKEVPAEAWVAVTNLALSITASGSPTNDLVLEFRQTNSAVLAGATVTPAMAVGALNLTLNQPALLRQGVPYLLTARLAGTGSLTTHYYRYTALRTEGTVSPNLGPATWGGTNLCYGIVSGAGYNWATFSAEPTLVSTELSFSFSGIVQKPKTKGAVILVR